MKSSKPLTAHRIQRDANFKYVKSRVCIHSCFDFCKFISFTAAKKTGHDFPQNRFPVEVRYLISVYQILPSFTEGNARKFLKSGLLSVLMLTL